MNDYGKCLRISKKNALSDNRIEEEIIAKFFYEHDTDIGGFKPKNYLEVADVKDPSPFYSHYFPVPVQKFELPPDPELTIDLDKITSSAEKLKTSTGFGASFKKSVDFESSLQRQKEKNKKIENLIEKMEPPVDSDDIERFAKIQARNKKVYNMVDGLLRKTSKRSRLPYMNFK